MTFDEFTATRLPAVLSFAAVLICDRVLAEDVVQEVLGPGVWAVAGERAAGPPGGLRPKDDRE